MFTGNRSLRSSSGTDGRLQLEVGGRTCSLIEAPSSCCYQFNFIISRKRHLAGVRGNRKKKGEALAAGQTNFPSLGMDRSRQVFTVDLLDRFAAKGRGVITCMAAGNDVIVLGTSKGWLIRHDFGGGDSYGSVTQLWLKLSPWLPDSVSLSSLGILFLDFDLTVGRTGEQSVHRVFVDPGGSHCIATVTGNGGSETYYIHAKWSKPRVLSKLKGLVVNAVAWNRQQITEGSFSPLI